MSDRRPPVALVMPFVGSVEAREEALERLAPLCLTEDEIVVVDNAAAAAAEAPLDARVLRAPAQQSSYYARNRGVEATTAEWIVFIDADVHPEPGLLEGYFSPPPDDGVGLLAGRVIDEEPAGGGWAARYSYLRRLLDQENTLAQTRSYAKTANCAVRRTAWEAIGGFTEGIRSGGDADFCFRLAAAGWRIDERPAAAARHRGRATLVGLLGQRARYGSGAAWLSRRYPGFADHESIPVVLRQTAYGLVASLAYRARGERDEAILRALNPLGALAVAVGWHVPNRPWREMLRR
jgi:GT2 family glycosyltransferase